MLRTGSILVFLTLLTSSALADCPASCVGGGPPDSTDCFVAWSGISSTALTCTDGDPTCDTDGKVDGVCTLPLQACINVVGLGSCSSSGLSGPPTVKPANNPTGQALAAKLAALNPTAPGCTPPGLALPLIVSLRGIKPGKAKLTVSATSGGKRDKDKLKLTCQPSTAAPSFAQQVQPIFSAKCAFSGCHDQFFKAGGQDLDPGAAYGSSVGARATIGKLMRVKPGSIKGSDMAHRILGQGIPSGGTQMPQGCPGLPPMCPGVSSSAPPSERQACCLTTDETFTILSWIANGAPNN